MITHKKEKYRKLCSKVVNSDYEAKVTGRSRVKMNIALETILDKIPIIEIRTTAGIYIQPFTKKLPDKRLGRVVEEMAMGIMGGKSPVITKVAQQISKTEGESWATAKRSYRLLDNKRIRTSEIYEGLYQVGCQEIAQERPEYLVAAVDPVNFEKPYIEVVEGASIVHKATPPDLSGHARLAHGYPAITATIVNTKVPVISYANWFSYEIVFTQMTKTDVLTLWAGGDHIPDLNIPIRNYHSVDQQFHQLAFVFESGVFQPSLDPFAEHFNRCAPSTQFGLAVDLAIQLLFLFFQSLITAFQVTTPASVLGQRNNPV